MKAKIIFSLLAVFCLAAPGSANISINKVDYFNSSITFSSEYVIPENSMPYGLYTPSSASENNSIPMIVWLHSDAENNCNLDYFFNHGLTKVLNNWELEGFNAYILFPHLTGEYNAKRWNNEEAVSNLKALLDDILLEYDIDREKVIVVGHSIGGQGALYMALKLPDYFSKAVSCSGFDIYTEELNFTIPVRAYVGTADNQASIAFTKHKLSRIIGDENIFVLDTDHSGVPFKAFTQDSDNNNCSDLVEWMLE